MVKTRSQFAEAASLRSSDNDDRQSSEEEEPQSSDEEDLDPTSTKLLFVECLSKEKEDPKSSHHPHAVRLTRKKPDDPPSRRLSSTPSPQPNKVEDVVELARKRTGEFLPLPEPKLSKPETEDDRTAGWRINVVAVRQDPPPSITVPNTSERQNNTVDGTTIDPPGCQSVGEEAAIVEEAAVAEEAAVVE